MVILLELICERRLIIESCRKFGEHLAECAFVIGDAEDVMVGPDDRGPAAMAVEPARENAILFGDSSSGLIHRVLRTEADQPHPIGPDRLYIGGQIRRVSLVQHQPPPGSRGAVEQAPPGCRSDPGLRKQRAVRRMERERQQTFLKRRDNLLARDGAGMTAAFGENAGIARLGRDRIALADDVTDRLDPGGELANMLASFLGIAVEQPVAGLPVENPVELPDEISDIANALAHALADKGRLLMRGIAGEEYPAPPPFRGDERMKPVARRTPQRRVVRRDPSARAAARPDPALPSRGGSSPGSSMISKRRWLPGPMMKDVGRDGSQNCAAVSGSFPSAALLT